VQNNMLLDRSTVILSAQQERTASTLCIRWQHSARNAHHSPYTLFKAHNKGGFAHTTQPTPSACKSQAPYNLLSQDRKSSGRQACMYGFLTGVQASSTPSRFILLLVVTQHAGRASRCTAAAADCNSINFNT
jgi:hypothetical protein